MASRDFLGEFGRDGGPAPAGGAAAEAGESDEVELTLGLSLGGCFGADPSQDGKQQTRLLRSSSIASICSLPAATSCGAHDAAPATAPPPDQLLRTSSLPAEYMEDRLRRRAIQSQRRLDAKRKRLERRNSMNSRKPAPAAGGAAARDEGLEHTVPSGFQLRHTVAALTTAGSPTPSRPQQGLAERRAEANSLAAAPTSSDGASVGQSSSSLVPKEAVEGRRPSDGGAPCHEQQQQPPAAPLRTLRSLTMRTASTGDLRNTMAEDMPMVSYRAEGPSGGRKTDGFLYKYRKGEEVRIVCVCHGSFLTPAEFVKHAGGGEVTNPLRHIVVNPQQSVFL